MELNRRSFLRLLGLAAAAPAVLALARPDDLVEVRESYERYDGDLVVTKVELYGINPQSYAAWSGTFLDASPVPMTLAKCETAIASMKRDASVDCWWGP